MKKYEVACIGNPLLDFIVEVEDSFLESLTLTKGGMHLIDKEQGLQIISMLGDKDIKIAPGGSASNVAANVCTLGGKAIFLGAIGYDDNGELYDKISDKNGLACYFNKKKNPTGYAITFITPDHERTFATFLGAALELDSNDIRKEVIEFSRILHLEGFQFETENQLDAAIKAMKIAKDNNVLISVDVADSLFINANRELVTNLLEEYVDIVFANDRESFALTQKDPEESVVELGSLCKVAVVTLGKGGSLVFSEGVVTKIGSVEVEEVNTNGAGDMYDAAFLLGFLKNFNFQRIGEIASFAASEVVKVPGARLEEALDTDLNQ